MQKTIPILYRQRFGFRLFNNIDCTSAMLSNHRHISTKSVFKTENQFVLCIFLFLFFSCSEIKQPPGVLAKDSPKQTPITQSKVWEQDEYFINAIAQFELKAKVLGKERYRFDRESDIAPYDLALGWGRMSDQIVVDKINIWQSGRWFYWKTDKYPIPRREIEISSANMHIIPASDEIMNELDDIIVGEIIYLKGFLVSAMAPKDGFRWKSSLTRNDTGGGACELIWVEKLMRIK